MAEEAEELRESLAVLVLKYFVHGILFSLLGLGFVLVALGFLLALMVLGLGGILALIAVLYIIPLFIGAANSVVTELLWFPVEYSWVSTWVHGGLLLIVLIIVGFIVSLPLSVISQPASIVVNFIVGAFIDGFIGKKIAEMWEGAAEEEEEEETQKPAKEPEPFLPFPRRIWI